MKKTLLTLMVCFAAASVMAIPAKRGVVRTIQLVDGTTVQATLIGDEHMRYMQDANGNKYVSNGEGKYVVANIEAMQKRAVERRMKSDQRRMKRLPRKAAENNAIAGSKKGLIILVQFSDLSFKDGHDNALFNSIANEVGYNQNGFNGSVHDYFDAQSRGQFDLTFDVVGPITISKRYSYYGGNDQWGNDKHPGEMVKEACQAADSEVNFADFDWNGDGELEQVFILYAGFGEADYDDENTIYPHEWNLDSEGTGTITIDGVKIDTYACGPELQPGSFTWQLNGLGTICHEFSHCLGYPDMYDTAYQNIGMGSWDLMDMGSYNGESFCPAGFTSYERMVAGWLQPTELTEAVEVKSLKALSEGGESYVMYNDGHKDEYFLLENRVQSGWDEDIPGEGLLIIHVDYDENLWYYNAVNTTSGDYAYGNDHQRMTPVLADNKAQYEVSYGSRYYTEEGMATDVFPYKTNDVFSNTSKPAATLYNANTDGKKLLNKKVYDIAKNNDGTIDFKFDIDDGSGDTPGPGPDPTPTDYLFYESFDNCDGTGGNDNLWQGGIANKTFNPDNEGWVAEKAYGASQCAKFGTTKVAGVVVTPTITLDGESTFRFSAAAWGDEECNLSLEANGATLGTTAFELPNKHFDEFTSTISAKGDFTITFTPSKTRFFLDEVIVEKPTSTGITQVNTYRLRPTAIYTLDGRYCGNNPQLLRKGIYIVNGRKVVIK